MQNGHERSRLLGPFVHHSWRLVNVVELLWATGPLAPRKTVWLMPQNRLCGC